MKARLIILSLLFLGACSLSGPRQAATWYVLEDQGTAGVGTKPGWPGTLLIRETDAPTFYQSSAMAYSRAPGTRGHYQYARQTELPAPRIAQLIRQRLERSTLFPAVVPLGSGVEGGYQLNTRLLDFYHDAARAPGEVKLLLEVELVRRSDAHLLARTRIETQAPAPSHDARGAALGANAALTQALDQLTAWLAGLPRVPR
ncbi:MAG: ABC-type transport auxiliary lipoprotein family protein [Pseudomonadota bacterium]|nr:ABC-type transport auxiliary lipoprotein family protein [Pseudomonadota bacterium]